MKIIKKKYNNVDSKKINQYPWGFNKMLKFKRRKWLSKKYNEIFSTTGNLQAVRKKFLITYKLKTKLLFKKYFASKMTERQFKKLFRSNARYKATFYNIIKTEHRLDSIIFRLFLFSSIFQARNLIKNNFFIVNNLIQNNPTFILNPGDIIKPSNFYSFNLCYNNILNIISSTYKYLNRIFNKYSYPFIIKKISTRFKEGFPKLGKPLRTIVKRIVKNVKWETTRRYKLKYKPQRFLTTYLGLYLTNNKQKHIKQSSKKFKNLVHWQKKTSRHTRSRYTFLKTKQLFKRRVYNLPLFNYRILQLPVKRHLRRFTKKRLLNRWFSLKNIQQPAFYNFKITTVLNKTVSDELRDFRNKKLQNRLKHRSKKTIIKERKNLFKKKKLLRSNKIMFKKEKLKKLKIRRGYLLKLKKKKKFLNLKKKKIVYYSVTKSLKSNVLFFSELNFIPKNKKLNFNKKKTFKIFKTSKLSADTQKKIISSKIVKQLNYIYCINKKIKFASEIGKYLFTKKKVKRDFANTKEKNMLESLELWESKNFSKRIRLMPVKEMFFRKFEMRKLRKRRKLKFRVSKNRYNGRRFKFKKFSPNPLRNVERKPKRLKLYYQLNNTMNLLNFITKKKVIEKIKKKKKILKKKKIMFKINSYFSKKKYLRKNLKKKLKIARFCYGWQNWKNGKIFYKRFKNFKKYTRRKAIKRKIKKLKKKKFFNFYSIKQKLFKNILNNLKKKSLKKKLLKKNYNILYKKQKKLKIKTNSIFFNKFKVQKKFNFNIKSFNSLNNNYSLFLKQNLKKTKLLLKPQLIKNINEKISKFPLKSTKIRTRSKFYWASNRIKKKKYVFFKFSKKFNNSYKIFNDFKIINQQILISQKNTNYYQAIPLILLKKITRLHLKKQLNIKVNLINKTKKLKLKNGKCFLTKWNQIIKIKKIFNLKSKLFLQKFKIKNKKSTLLKKLTITQELLNVQKKMKSKEIIYLKNFFNFNNISSHFSIKNNSKKEFKANLKIQNEIKKFNLKSKKLKNASILIKTNNFKDINFQYNLNYLKTITNKLLQNLINKKKNSKFINFVIKIKNNTHIMYKYFSKELQKINFIIMNVILKKFKNIEFENYNSILSLFKLKKIKYFFRNGNINNNYLYFIKKKFNRKSLHIFNSKNLKTKKIIMFKRFKRKYLKLKGSFFKFNNLKIKLEFLPKSTKILPIQIKYKKIDLLLKHRPICYYFIETDYSSLIFTLLNDVDLFKFPYKTFLDFKTISHLYTN